MYTVVTTLLTVSRESRKKKNVLKKEKKSGGFPKSFQKRIFSNVTYLYYRFSIIKK